MTIFRTEITLSKSKWDITHHHKILMLGSCFTQNIGDKLTKHHFKVTVNPFGITFNPNSVVKQLNLLLEKKKFNSSDLFQYNGIWHSWQHHSNFSNQDKNKAVSIINDAFFAAKKSLKQADYLIITLGTAYVYRLVENGETVNNCHQYPNKNFTKSLLKVDDIVTDFTSVLNTLKVHNKKLKVIFTVSPVRHWKDGVIQNQVSKSALLLAVNKLCSQFDFVNYFPAYEIVMDDLRDYRFYKADMLHPNNEAVNYIWRKFSHHYFNDTTLGLIERIEKLNKAKSHRPRFPMSEQHLAFLAQLKVEEDILMKEIE